MKTPMTGNLPQAVGGVRDLFTAEDAERFFSGSAGKPYQPANGSEGEMFMRLWCADCQRDAAFRADPDSADGCPIIADTMCHSADDPDYPPEWKYSERGQPVCTAFEAKDTTDRQPQIPGSGQDQ
jgi:hypothetical protein